MKTHEFAHQLSKLAKLMKTSPNLEVDDFLSRVERGSWHQTENVAVNLHTLAELSSIDKKQWLSLIHAYNFPIEIRPRDASRDILGKLLKFLEENPEAREKLKKTVVRSTTTSPALMQALETLLRQ